MFEAMPRQVLTAQLIVDKHHAMALANATFKALAAIWRRHADMRRVKYRPTRKITNHVFVLSVSDQSVSTQPNDNCTGFKTRKAKRQIITKY